MMNLCELANNYAIDFYVSDLGDNTYNEFYDSLCDGVIPDDVSIWSPFEHCDADDLIEHIENLTLAYTDFYKEAQKCMS
jgi:hypothetical protein